VTPPCKMSVEGGSILRLKALEVVSAAIFTIIAMFCGVVLYAQQSTFRNAPASATAMKNPYANSAAGAVAGKAVYAKNCMQCHGNNRQGMGPAPALDGNKVRTANAGELFWFIGTGNPASGMPAWANLPKQQRWQLVTFLQSASK
jgi:mono/diheme cytochrome c family protein